MTHWPDRMKNFYAEDSRVLEDTWTYRVRERPEQSSGHRILVTGRGDTQFLLQFDNNRSLQSVDRIRDRRDNYWKLQRIHTSPTENRSFLVSGWSPNRPVFWAHPFPRFVEGSEEYNYVRGGRSVQKRLRQDVQKKDRIYQFDVVNESEQSRATFKWDPTDPWWHEARFFYRDRLILRAVRIDP